MSASNFRPSLALVLAHEGGYSNHPLDPGGATNFGVTQKVYDAYRNYHGSKLQPVKNIASSEVSDIYNKNYWRLVRGDSLPCGIDYAVFDFAVNSGVSRAVKYLQRLVGVEADGVIGFMSLDAIEKADRANPEKLIAQYCSNRLEFLKQLPSFNTFGLGWTRRVVGYQAGVQKSDTGVVDYATFMAKRESAYILPTAIGGGDPNELNSKAYAQDDLCHNIIGPIVSNASQLRASLAATNDQLATMIAGN